MNSKIDIPTRKAKAVAMLPFLGFCPSTGGVLPRIMYSKADPKLNNMPMNAMTTMIFMDVF